MRADVLANRLQPRAPLVATISIAAWIACACSSRSNGFTDSAHGPSSSCAPAFSERISTPSRSLTSGASFATRFSPS